MVTYPLRSLLARSGQLVISDTEEYTIEHSYVYEQQSLLSVLIRR